MSEATNQNPNFGEISFDELVSIAENGNMLVIDVREPHEVAEAHLKAKTFVNIPLKEIEKAFSTSDEEFRELFRYNKPRKQDDIAFICRSGRRTKLALAEMIKLGYSRCRHFDGGTIRLLQDHPEVVERRMETNE